MKNKIDCIAYGSEDGGATFYVQTACSVPHTSENKCHCKNLGEGFTQRDAKIVASQMSKNFGVPIQKW